MFAKTEEELMTWVDDMRKKGILFTDEQRHQSLRAVNIQMVEAAQRRINDRNREAIQLDEESRLDFIEIARLEKLIKEIENDVAI